jgi:hypothetical protein
MMAIGGYEHFDRGVVVDRFVQPAAHGPGLDWLIGEQPTAAGGALGPLATPGVCLAPHRCDLTPAAPVWRWFQVAYRG